MAAERVTGPRRAAIIALLWSRRSTVFRPFPRPSVNPVSGGDRSSADLSARGLLAAASVQENVPGEDQVGGGRENEG